MSLDARFDAGPGRDATLTLTLEGCHDIFRFAINMLDQQVEFGQAGRVVLVELREHLTPQRFDPMARSLLGEVRYERLRSYFERDQFCAGCETAFEPGQRYAPVKDAEALCESCAVRYAPDVALVEAGAR